MKKTILISAFILLALNTSIAQIFTLGPKAGINYSELLIDETFTHEGVDFTYATQEAKVSFAYGAFARIKIGSFFVQPEIVFTRDQTDIELKSVNLLETQTLSINKMDIPVNAGIMIGNFLRLQGGPVFSYVQSAHVNSPTKIWDSFADNYSNSTLGYQVGVGLDIGRITLDGRMEGNLSSLGTQMTIGSETFQFDHRQKTFQITVGYKLIK